MATAPEVGQPAPDFSLLDQFGAPRQLSSLRGRSNALVVFFPHAFTPVCTDELAALQAAGEEFTSSELTTMGISCDPVASLKAFGDREALALPLLSDFWPHGEVSRAYGVFVEARGFSNRGTFLIDREGVLRWSVVTSPGEARSMQAYRTALAALG